MYRSFRLQQVAVIRIIYLSTVLRCALYNQH